MDQYESPTHLDVYMCKKANTIVPKNSASKIFHQRFHLTKINYTKLFLQLIIRTTLFSGKATHVALVVVRGLFNVNIEIFAPQRRAARSQG